MQVRCPQCQQFANWENNPYRPFCSEFCKQRDLGNWATEQYRVPMHDVTEEAPPRAQKKKTDEEEEV
jgi:endogenous inhibitor of DNA gyrase (YacG/DUF329 family)